MAMLCLQNEILHMMRCMCFFLCPSIQSHFHPNLRPTRKKKKSGFREVGTGNAQTLYGHMGSVTKIAHQGNWMLAAEMKQHQFGSGKMIVNNE